MSNEQVFISYAEPDSEFAHRLADDLEAHGMAVWIAPESVRPGETWVDAIDRGLSESDYLVITLTPAAMESDWVRKETSVGIMLERKGQLTLIPLDVKPADVGPLLSSYQMVSFHEEYDAGFERLSGELGIGNGASVQRRQQRAEPDPSPARPTTTSFEWGRLKDVLASLAAVDTDEINPDSDLVRDLNMDELDFIELVMELEETYGIEIPHEDVFVNPESPLASDWRLSTVDAVAHYIQKRMGEYSTEPARPAQRRAPTAERGGPPQQRSRPAAATSAYEERSFYSQPLWWVSLIAFPLISAVAAIFAHFVLATLLTWVGFFLPRGDAAFLVLAIAGVIWGLIYAVDGAISGQEPGDYLLSFLGPYDDLLAGVDAEDRVRGLLSAMPVNIFVSWGIANAIGFALRPVMGGIDPLTIYAIFALLSIEGIRRYIAYVV